MRSKLLIGGLLASVMIVPALAQSNPPASAAQLRSRLSGRHRPGGPAGTCPIDGASSKLIGLECLQ